MRRSTENYWVGRKVFVTGAASGIGRSTALALAARGARLFLTDLHDVGLTQVVDEIATSTVSTGSVDLWRPLDITDFDAVASFAAQIHESFGSMDAVMNIAGISTWGTVDRLEHRHWTSMIEVNLLGPICVIENFIPPMMAAGRGGNLVNVASAAGLFGLPWHAAYSASKFGLRGVSEVLRFDLRRHRIAVSLVCPGGVATPLSDTVEIVGVDINDPAVARLKARFRRRAVTPEQAASSIIDGVTAGRYLIYTSPDIRRLHSLQRHLPPLYNLAMRALNRWGDRTLSAALVLPTPHAEPAPIHSGRA